VDRIKEFIYSIVQPNESEWEEFSSRVYTRRFKAGDFLLCNGEQCSEIHFINQGAARLFYSTGDEEINTYFAFENNFICDYRSFLSASNSRYSIQAMEDMETIALNRETVHYGFETFHVWNKFGRIITEQFYLMLESRMESFLFMTAEERYIAVLEAYPGIFERVPLYHIASYLGIKGPSLSRIRKRIVAKN
jgi:CRP/FNR family transcriptional regulator, anaerobic regulatory protein